MAMKTPDNPSFKPWGPLISPNFKSEPITRIDIIIAAVVFVLTLVNVGIAIWLITAQTKTSRAPAKSVYIWMIWVELIVCVIMSSESFLHLLKLIPPSFAFYFTILFCWCVQVQLLLQIIINRIRIIDLDRNRSRWIMIATASFVTVINVSVFCIWIPTRLQISDTYHRINEVWDRLEKVLYLIVDAALNWYFLKTVKANLINNGLTKYNKLVQFNQRIVIISLLMDVMIIGAMWIPNSFVYIQFHPLAYLVKLNIEMTMANLIKRIAVSTCKRTGQGFVAKEFKSSSNYSSTGRRTLGTFDTNKAKRDSIHELENIVADKKSHERVLSIATTHNQIKTTQEVTITHETNNFFGHNRRGTEVEITGDFRSVKIPRTSVQEARDERGMSLESVTETADSLRSADTRKRSPQNESDDELALVAKNVRSWQRRAD